MKNQNNIYNISLWKFDFHLSFNRVDFLSNKDGANEIFKNILK